MLLLKLYCIVGLMICVKFYNTILTTLLPPPPSLLDFQYNTHRISKKLTTSTHSGNYLDYMWSTEQKPLHNSVIYHFEIHWVKDECYRNNLHMYSLYTNRLAPS